MITAITPTATPYFGKVAPVAANKNQVPAELQAELKAKGIEIAPDTEYIKYTYKGPLKHKNSASLKKAIDNNLNIDDTQLASQIADKFKLNAKIFDQDTLNLLTVMEFDSKQAAQEYFQLSEELSNNHYKKTAQGSLSANADMGSLLNLEDTKKSVEDQEEQLLIDTMYGMVKNLFKGIQVKTDTFIGKNPTQVINYSQYDATVFHKQKADMEKFAAKKMYTSVGELLKLQNKN